jgi:DNA-binding NarL/FixJ family response regulator
MGLFFQIGLAVLGLAAGATAIWFYFRLRGEFDLFSQFTRKAITEEEFTSRLAGLEVRLAELEARLADSNARRQQDAEWLAQAESLNLNRRGQVIRLHRRGESPASIAQTLRLAPGEVKLIIKVFELGREKSDTADEI